MRRKVDDTHKEIAARLLLLRERLIGNASEFARRIGVTPQAWYNYEAGRRSLDVKVLLKLIQQWDIDANYVILGTTQGCKRWVRVKLEAEQALIPVPLKRKKKRKPRKKPKPDLLDEYAKVPHPPIVRLHRASRSKAA